MKDGDFLNSTLEIIGSSCKTAGVEDKYRTFLYSPKRKLIVNYPVTMDDGEISMITALRAQHNDALGPYKGGIRYHQDCDMAEVGDLAFWMTIESGESRGICSFNRKTL